MPIKLRLRDALTSFYDEYEASVFLVVVME